MKRNIVLAITGSSGSLYAKLMMERLLTLHQQWNRVGIILSENAKINWQLETGQPWNPAAYSFDFYEKRDFNAPFASGSANYETMIVCPCSMGTLGRIANGISDDLITRAADVVLKERRRLILVARETPLSLIHLRNMTSVTEAGAIVCPAIPSFYSGPKDIEALVGTVVDRVLDLAGFHIDSYRWGDL